MTSLAEGALPLSAMRILNRAGRVFLMALLVLIGGCATSSSSAPHLEVTERVPPSADQWRPPSARQWGKYRGRKGQVCVSNLCYGVSPDPKKFVRAYLIAEHGLRGRDLTVEDLSIQFGSQIRTVLEVSFFGDRVMHLTLYELPLGDEMDSKIEGKSHLQLALESAAREIYERYRRHFPRQ